VVVRIGIQADDNGIGQELSDFFIKRVGVKQLVVDAGQIVLREAANGFSRAHDGVEDGVFIKCHQRPVAFLHLDDAVLDWHGGSIATLDRMSNHHLTRDAVRTFGQPSRWISPR